MSTQVPRLFGTLVLGFSFALHGAVARSQEPEIERPAPPAADGFESDTNGDGVPDGWYNARDAAYESRGGKVGPHFIRFECQERGRPARLSRAFGIDGRKTEAIVIGLWIRLHNVQYGERSGEEPSLLIDFLGDSLRNLSRGVMGQWTHNLGESWTRVVKRIPVPPGTRDAIMSVGLLGARGRLDIDGLSIDLVPVGGTTSTNLVVNGDFELGDPGPAYWIVENDAYRVFPGHASAAAVELGKVNSRVLTGLALPVGALGTLRISLHARAQGLRGSGGATAAYFFLDSLGKPIAGTETGVYAFEWSGSFDWRKETTETRIPPQAKRAVIQFEKIDSLGRIQIDDVSITVAPNPEMGAWLPFHASDETDGWMTVAPSPGITAKSALDVSFLVSAPAGERGFVVARDGRLAFEKGGRPQFHGVSLIAPTAFQEPQRAFDLADRLVRSGVNLVRLGDLDTPLGPDRSLFDDSRDDTKELDPVALERLDHLIATLKARGIYVALELQSCRRFRDQDGVALAGDLPAGGGPAALFSPELTKRSLESARQLLGHKNPETGLALKDDPALAWITLLGEVSLFDLIDRPDDALPGPYAQELRVLGQKSSNTIGTGRRFWQVVEMAHYKTMGGALRNDGVRVPIAGCSHWRREPEFSAGLAAPPLDLVDDRLFWLPSIFAAAEMKSQLWGTDGSLSAGAARKRHPGVAYAVGQWCPQTRGAWALPYEAADVLLAAHTALHEDWEALVRRGVFLYPQNWGEGPAGTVGGEDIFQVAEVANASPQVYALWPHAASLLLRRPAGRSRDERDREREHAARTATVPWRRTRTTASAGWDPARGRVVLETPYTQGIAGWFGGEPVALSSIDIASDSPFAVVVVSSVGPEPISTAKRLLVTVVGRVEPTGFRWVDSFQRDVADPGRPPLLQEPIFARVTWRRRGKIGGYVLGPSGDRLGSAKIESRDGGSGATLVIDGKVPAFHWELTEE
ncbi:MAG: hypothetical protein ACLP7Q_23570 [Isosphaeraceae bacterium]